MGDCGVSLSVSLCHCVVRCVCLGSVLLFVFLCFALFLKHFRDCPSLRTLSQGLSFWFRWRVTGAVACLACPLYFDDVSASIFIADPAHSHSPAILFIRSNIDSVCPVPLRVLRLHFLRMFICSNSCFF